MQYLSSLPIHDHGCLSTYLVFINSFNSSVFIVHLACHLLDLVLIYFFHAFKWNWFQTFARPFAGLGFLLSILPLAHRLGQATSLSSFLQ